MILKINWVFFQITVDGSLSDTAVSSVGMLDRQKHPNLHRPGGGVGGSNQQLQQQPGGPGGPNAAGGPGGMGKKSNSTSQLSAAGKA